MSYKFNAFTSDFDIVNDLNSIQIDQSGGTTDTFGILSGVINGVNTVFTVSLGSYGTGKLTVFLNGQMQTQGSSQDWVELSPTTGTFQFLIAPTVGDEILVEYNKTAQVSNTISWGNISGTLSAQTDLYQYITSVKVIKQASDWGTPVAGVVTLTNGTHYIVDFLGEMTLPFTLALPNFTGATSAAVIINGLRASSTRLRLDSSLTNQALFSGGNNCTLTIRDIALRASGVGQKIYDLNLNYPVNAAFGVLPVFLIYNVTHFFSTEIGILSGIYGYDFDKYTIVGCTQGFTFDNISSVGIFKVGNILSNATGFIAYNFPTTCVIQNRFQFDTQGLNLGTNQTGFKIQNNLGTGSLLFTSLAYSTSSTGNTAIDVTPTATIPTTGLLLEIPSLKMLGTGSFGLKVQSGATVQVGGIRISDLITNVATGSSSIDFSTTAVASPKSLYVTGGSFTGSGSYITGIGVQDIKLVSKDNVGLADSKKLGSFSFQNLTNGTSNTIPTIITTQGVATKILGTTTSNYAFRFTHTNNKLTYIDVDSNDFFVSFSGAVQSTSNNTNVITYLVKNGTTIIYESKATQRLFTAGQDYNISFTTVPVTLVTNDYIELFIINSTSTASLTLSDGTLTIR